MYFLSCFQALLLLMVLLFVTSSPLPEEPAKESTEGPLFVLSDNDEFPVADLVEGDKNIKTHVVGKMDDLEATTWVSSLSELNFTIPPSLIESAELEDFVD